MNKKLTDALRVLDLLAPKDSVVIKNALQELINEIRHSNTTVREMESIMQELRTRVNKTENYIHKMSQLHQGNERDEMERHYNQRHSHMPRGGPLDR